MDKKIELEKQEQTKPLIHDFNKQSVGNSFTPRIIGLMILVIVLGILSGYLVAGKSSPSVTSGGKTINLTNTSSIPKGTIIGSNDTATFKDTAEGVLKTGGIDGEGAYHLVRPGGSSQNVYLTSSIVDLSKFIGKNIKVWGQTQKAQYAGWLMDVGRVEVL